MHVHRWYLYGWCVLLPLVYICLQMFILQLLLWTPHCILHTLLRKKLVIIIHIYMPRRIQHFYKSLSPTSL